MSLPSSWVKAQLSELCARVSDGSHNPPKAQENGLPMLSARNVSGRRIVFDEYRLISQEEFAEEDRRTQVTSGDVLLTIVGAIGRTAVVPAAVQPFTLQRSVAVLKFRQGDSRFFSYALEAPTTQSYLQENAKGTAQKGIYLKALAGVEIPVAPLAEQKRIADKLDTVLTRVDAVNTRLARVAPILKRFRQAVLAAATSGRLTEDWRAGRTPDWEQPLFADVVVESSTGLVRSASEQFSMQDNFVPYLKMNSIGEMWGYDCVDLPGVRCSAEEFKRYELRHGDWLFNTRNSVELVGKSCVWNGPAGVVFNNNLLRVRFQAGINPIWVEIFFRSPMGRDLLATVKSATTSVAAIYQRSLMGLTMLCPPEEEQAEIVRRVETLFAFADRLEARLQTAQTATERLTPALLAKAFRGELVPQDPNDEPASELLKRLAASAPASTQKRGRPKVSTAA